jgi:hypothetical protein
MADGSNHLLEALSLLGKPWTGIALLAFLLGTLTATVKNERASLWEHISQKADTMTIRDIQRDMHRVQSKLDSMSLRQHEFFCDQKPRFCR